MLKKAQLPYLRNLPDRGDSLPSLKPARFYTRRFSAQLLILLSIWSATLVRALLPLRSASTASGSDVAVACGLFFYIFPILFHRYKMRHLIKNEAVDERILSEMANIALFSVIGVCTFALIVVR